MATPTETRSQVLTLRGADEHFVVASEQLGCRTLKALNEMRTNKTFCDVTIKASGMEIHAHKNILSVHSDFFKAMFSVDMIETQTQTATFNDISHDILKALIDYMYTGRLKVSQGRVQDTLVMADMLQMIDVKQACINFMLARLDVDNCIGFFNFSEQYNCAELNIKSREVIKLGFSIVCHKEEFLQLTAARLKHILSWSDLKLGPASEDVVLQAVARWLKHDVDTRGPELAGVLQQVRVQDVSEKCYENVLQNEPFVGNKDLGEALKSAWHSPTERPSRTPPFFVFVFAGCLQSRIGCMTSNKPWTFPLPPPRHVSFSSPRLRTVEKMDTLSRAWSESTQIPKHASIIDVFNVAGRLLCFVCRAHDGASQVRVSFAELYEYKYYVNTWELLRESMSEGVIHCLFESHFDYGAHVYCESQRRLYIVTWHMASYVNVTVDEDSGEGDISMRQVEQLPGIEAFADIKHRDFAVVVCAGRLYCIGGMRFESLSERYVLSTTYMFDSEARVWTPKAEMLQGRASFAAVEMGSNIYVFGGFSGQRLKAVETYDSTTDTWTSLTSMWKVRTYMAAVTVHNKIYVMGGQSYSRSMGDGRKVLASCETYDPVSDTWTLESNMLAARCLFDAVAV